MLKTTRGIVLNQVKYGESSIIARIYTEQLGIQSYLIRGARSKKAKIRAAHLQHLTLVELEVNQRVNKDIQHLKSLKIAYPFKDIPFNIKKSAVVVFLNEVLYKVIREEEPNHELFEFLFNAIQFLDLTTGSVGLFHHTFMVILSKFLGFYPRNNYSEGQANFDLEAGEFTSMSGPQQLYATPPVSLAFHEVLIAGIDDMDKLSIPSAVRNGLLEMLINYYRLHVPGLKEIKSYSVLTEIFE